jgi:DNA-directed RNA polymerase subunit RPC12/RpoP
MLETDAQESLDNFTCRYCGAGLDVQAGDTYTKCSYCGRKTHIPTKPPEKKLLSPYQIAYSKARGKEQGRLDALRADQQKHRQTKTHRQHKQNSENFSGGLISEFDGHAFLRNASNFYTRDY